MTNNRIHISIAFGDAILPVVECDDGHNRVPLKPIADEIGVNWQSQTRKLEEGKYLHKRLGVEVTPLRGGDKPYICIRVDRVTAYLNTLNPEKIRCKGNHDAADWLESKHDEWDNALHAYETNGFATKAQQSEAINIIAKIDKIQNAELKRSAAKLANTEFNLDINIGKQEPLEL